ncbi:uncharacterized protein TNCV_4789821 [Trichonephila clavipes]|nr:uncharacterized protein TNCV_4789821 [Trichonephila clavipes]
MSSSPVPLKTRRVGQRCTINPSRTDTSWLGQRKQVCLQWIPSHVDVSGNEAADELAGCDLPNPSSTVLTHTEIPSFRRNKTNLTWRNPPAHHWYAAKCPGLSIQCRSSRAHQTALARFRSGHLRNMTFVQGVKSFFTCPCSLLASPAHLLYCWGISLRQLYEEQELQNSLDFLSSNRLPLPNTWCPLTRFKLARGYSEGVVLDVSMEFFLDFELKYTAMGTIHKRYPDYTWLNVLY